MTNLRILPRKIGVLSAVFTLLSTLLLPAPSHAIDLSQYFKKQRNFITRQVTGVDFKIEEIKDGPGSSRWLRTVSIRPVDLLHRGLATGLNLSTHFLSVGGSSKLTYVFQQSFASEEAAQLNENPKDFAARVPKNIQSLLETLRPEETFKVDIESAVLLGVGPALDQFNISLAKAGFGQGFVGSIELEMRKAENGKVDLAVRIGSGNSSSLGAQLGSHHETDENPMSMSTSGEMTFEILPDIAGIKGEHREAKSAVKYVSIDTDVPEARQFLDHLFSQITPVSMQLSRSAGALTANAPIPLLDFNDLFGNAPIRGVSENGGGHVKSVSSHFDRQAGLNLHAGAGDDFETAWYVAEDADGKEISIVQNTITLESEFQLLSGKIWSESGKKTVQLTNQADSNGKTGEMLEIRFSTNYKGKKAPQISARQLLDHFSEFAPEDTLLELLGEDAANLLGGSEYDVSFSLSISPDALAKIRSGQSRFVQDELSREELDRRLENFISHYNLQADENIVVLPVVRRQMAEQLSVVFSKSMDSRHRVQAFKSLRMNPLFKKIAVHFILASIPREEWNDYFTLQISGRFAGRDGKIVSREIALGPQDQLSVGEHIGSIKSLALGHKVFSTVGAMKPGTLEKSCAALFN